jgi:hypothetical protein
MPLTGMGESSPAARLGQALRGGAAYADPGGADSPAQPAVRPAGAAPAPGDLVQRRPVVDAAARPVVVATRVAPAPEAPPLVLPRRAEGSPAGQLPGNALSATPPMLARTQAGLEASGGAPAEPAPPGQPPSAGAGTADADELAEQVMRKLMRQIMIESERRGRRP